MRKIYQTQVDEVAERVTDGIRVFWTLAPEETRYFFPHEPASSEFDCSVYDDLTNFRQGCSPEIFEFYSYRNILFGPN